MFPALYGDLKQDILKITSLNGQILFPTPVKKIR